MSQAPYEMYLAGVRVTHVHKAQQLSAPGRASDVSLRVGGPSVL